MDKNHRRLRPPKQGSVLGPTLFIIYLNELLDTLPQGTCLAYADDVTLFAHDANAVAATEKLQSLINTVSDWATKNDLVLNIAKCQHMMVGTTKRLSSIQGHASPHLNGNKLQSVTDLKLLGVTITCDLSWCRRARDVQKKMSSKIAVLKRFSSCLNTRAKLTVYNAFIRPHMNYAGCVWGNSSSSGIEKAIDRLQLRALKIIFNNTSPEVQLCSCIHPFRSFVSTRNITILCSQYMDYLPELYATHSYSTRSATDNKLRLPVCKLTIARQSTLYSAIVAWNSLPNTLTATYGTPAFMSGVYKHFNNVLF